MQLLKLLLITLCSGLLYSGIVLAQDSCTEELQTQLDTCIENATTSCQESVPECQPTGFDADDLQAALDDKCGVCNEEETPRNFGKFNSCLKKLRNGLRKAGLLDEDLRETLQAARKDCKAVIKDKKKGNSGDDDDSDDDSDDDEDEE